MIINIPGTSFGWWSDEVFAIYLILNIVLVIFYCLILCVCLELVRQR